MGRDQDSKPARGPTLESVESEKRERKDTWSLLSCGAVPTAGPPVTLPSCETGTVIPSVLVGVGTMGGM